METTEKERKKKEKRKKRKKNIIGPRYSFLKNLIEFEAIYLIEHSKKSFSWSHLLLIKIRLLLNMVQLCEKFYKLKKVFLLN